MRRRRRRRRRRKIGRSTILLVRRRASKQNAWSTSELFPFPATLASPSRPAPSLTMPGRRKLLPVAGAFFSVTPCRASPLSRRPRIVSFRSRGRISTIVGGKTVENWVVAVKPPFPLEELYREFRCRAEEFDPRNKIARN